MGRTSLRSAMRARPRGRAGRSEPSGNRAATRRFVASLAAAALACTACVTARNLLDPAGPRYEGHYAAAGAAAVPAPRATFRVVTFNIEHGRRVDGAIALLTGSEALRNPDVLFLQEMDPAGVERVARGLRLNYVYFPGSIHPSTGSEFGTAVLSPWPLDEGRKILLPHAPFTTRVRRAVTAAVVRRDELAIRVYSVHLPAPWSITRGMRREQVRLIADDAARGAGPVVIAGDFNGRIVGGWLRERGFDWVTEGLRRTARKFWFWGAFDHVFSLGLRPLTGGPASGVVDSAGTSDHRAVWATFELPPPAGAGEAQKEIPPLGGQSTDLERDLATDPAAAAGRAPGLRPAPGSGSARSRPPA